MIKTWIAAFKKILGSGWRYVRADTAVNSGAVRPAGKFLSVKIISGPIDYTMDEALDFAGDKTHLEIISAKSFTLSLQAHREGALDAINRIRLGLYDPDIVDFLRNDGKISVTTRGPVTDLSEDLETGFVERWQCDISFAVGMIYKTKIGHIEKAVVG